MSEKLSLKIVGKFLAGQNALASCGSVQELAGSAAGLLEDLPFLEAFCLCVEGVSPFRSGNFDNSACPGECDCFSGVCPVPGSSELFHYTLAAQEVEFGHLLLRFPQETHSEYNPLLEAFCIALSNVLASKMKEFVLGKKHDWEAKHFEEAVNGAAIGFWRWDLEKKTIRCNSRCAALHGFGKTELVLHDDDGIWGGDILQEDLPALRAAWQRHLDGESDFFETEYRLRLKDGKICWLWERGRIFEWEEASRRPRLAAGITSDISVRRDIQESLCRRETFHRLILDAISEIILIADSEGRLIFVSPGIEQAMGWTLEEALSKKDIQGLFGKMPRLLRKVWETEEAQNVEWEVLDKFGEPRLLLVTAKLVLYENKLCLFCSCRDITERRNIENDLMENLLFLQTVLDAIPSPVFSKDCNGVYNHCNTAFETFIGLSRKEILGRTACIVTPANYSEIHHQADLELLKEGGMRSYEAQVLAADGSRRDVLFKKATYTGAAGAVDGLICVMLDVTDIRRKDQELRLVTAGLQAAAYGVIVTSLQGEIIWVNQTFCELVGYGESEILGKNPRMFKSGLYDASFYKNIWDTILGGHSWHGEIINRKKDDTLYCGDLNITPVRNEAGAITHFIAMSQDITSRKQMEEKILLLHSAMEGAMEAVITIDMEGHLTYANTAFTEIFGYSRDELKTKDCYDFLFSNIFIAQQQMPYDPYSGYECETEISTKDGRKIPVFLRQTPIMNEKKQIMGLLSIMTDITERKKEREQQAMIEVQLRQSQKLEAIGNLAAGIAHELNTPIQFIGDNVSFMNDAFKELINVLLAYGRVCSPLWNGETPAPEILAESRSASEAVDLAYFQQEIPQALEQSLDGVKRIADIVRAMKEFSHPGSGEKKGIDINKAISNTVTVARNEWKYSAEVSLDLAKNVPTLFCYIGELNQVLLNILVNSAQAISEHHKKEGIKEKGMIRIATSSDEDWVKIEIEDNGPGIPDKIKGRIFDPFFTTKEIGKGTGQGLAISYDVIVNKHHGKLTFDSEFGRGTTFHIWLPRDTQERDIDGKEKNTLC